MQWRKRAGTQELQRHSNGKGTASSKCGQEGNAQAVKEDEKTWTTISWTQLYIDFGNSCSIPGAQSKVISQPCIFGTGFLPIIGVLQNERVTTAPHKYPSQMSGTRDQLQGFTSDSRCRNTGVWSAAPHPVLSGRITACQCTPHTEYTDTWGEISSQVLIRGGQTSGYNLDVEGVLSESSQDSMNP